MILACVTTLVLNLTSVPLNDFDMKTMKRAAVVCATNPRYNSGCLKKFVKKEELLFQAICGEKQDKKTALRIASIAKKFELEVMELSKDARDVILTKLEE